jgi:3-oxoacyl-[acyl-carrier protein] reductase
MAHKPRALVTGASKGIGAAIATSLAADGFEIVLNFRSSQDAALRVKEQIEVAGGSVVLAQFDVADADACAAALKTIMANGPPIGVLVNNAGVVADASFPIMNRKAWETVTRTTLDGFFNLTNALVTPMIRMKWGRIINISSISGLVGNRGQVNYSAAKAGLIGATRSLSLELAKRKITVNAIAPGFIETDMITSVPAEAIRSIPMRRFGQPSEVADLVSFLVSERATYITGQVIGINGGLA